MTTTIDQHDLEKLFELSVDALCVSSTNAEIICANPTFLAAFGYTQAQLHGRPFLFLVHPDDVQRTIDEVSGMATGATLTQFENRVLTSAGEVRWYQWSSRADGAGGRIYASGRDVTSQHLDRERVQQYADLLEQTQQELQSALEELTHLANTDPLTGILNRRAFQARALEEVSRCERDHNRISVAMFDIDHFKLVNDAHGHPTGDAVLQEVARRIDACRRGYDIVGRWGGEEFVALFPDSTSEGAQAAAERMAIAVAAPPIVIGPLTLDVRVSGGVVSRQGAGVESFDHLIKLADDALLRAKRAGRDRVEIVPDHSDPTVTTITSIAS